MEVVERLSEFLRTVLCRDAPQEVPLREELSLAKPYLALMGVRYRNRLAVTIDVEGVAADALVPRLILQPLLENAFLHGIDGRLDASQVRVSARIVSKQLELEVYDDGPGPEASGRSGFGMGLENVRSRLATLFGEHASFTLEPARGGGAAATIRLPMRVELGELEQPA